jgi:hypothetical protein
LVVNNGGSIVLKKLYPSKIVIGFLTPLRSR